MGLGLSASAVTLLELSGWVIAGILAVVGVFNRQSRQRSAEEDQTAQNLIKNLKTTTELQEKEITSLREKEITQGKEIAHLQGQVKTLTEILQGKDPAMQGFLKSAPELIMIAHENNGLAKAQADALKELTVEIGKLAASVNKIVEPTS